MSIESKAIAYGEARYGRSCGNCVYSERHPVLGLVCMLYDAPTKLYKCCGTWGGEKIPQPVEEKQEELF